MHKASLLAEQLVLEYSQGKKKYHPKMIWKADDHQKGESYTAVFNEGIVKVHGESPLAAAYGITQLKIAIEGDHLGDFLGNIQPRFSLRPIGVNCDVYCSPEEIKIALPSCLGAIDGLERKKNIPRFCKRIIELGYNAIFLDSKNNETSKSYSGVFKELEYFIQTVEAFGLNVILKLNLFDVHIFNKIKACPYNPDFKSFISQKVDLLRRAVPSLKYFFWESVVQNEGFTTPEFARDASLIELIVAELKLLEDLLGNKSNVIFYLPSSDKAIANQLANFMPRICDEAGKKTIIAFSAILESSFQENCLAHPFWEILRKSYDETSTPLLPLINVGLLPNGGDLWPAPVIDLLENYYNRLYRHTFAGVLAMGNVLPQQGGIIDCNLWIASQRLWRPLSSMQLAETWFNAFRSEWQFDKTYEIMQEISQLSVKLRLLQALTTSEPGNLIAEDCRIMTDSILANLREMKIGVEKIERKQTRKPTKSTLSNYLIIFIRDAQNIISAFLQHFNLKLPYAVEENELKGEMFEEIYLENKWH